MARGPHPPNHGFHAADGGQGALGNAAIHLPDMARRPFPTAAGPTGSSGRAWRDSRCRAVRDPAQVRNPVRLHGGRVLSANAYAYGGIDELAL